MRVMTMLRKVFVVITISIYLLLLSACSQVYTNSDEYVDYVSLVSGSDIFMPKLSDLPQYQSVDIYYFERLGTSINLIITFSAETYESAKEAIFESHLFLDEPLMEHGYYTIPEVEFEYQAFIIKVVSDDNFDYPEQFGMLGYSDTKFQIAFLFFYDMHLHELSGSSGRMGRFVRDEFRFPKE